MSEQTPTGGVDGHEPEPSGWCMHSGMLNRMQTTSVRIDTTTHAELKRLALDMGATVGATVAIAVRKLRQERIGGELCEPLNSDESRWLDAELG